MNKLRISLFGKFQTRFGESALTALDGHKVQALLCYLLLYPERPHSREVLANLLWDDASAAGSKGYLRKALWQIQTELNKYADFTNGNILQIDSEWIQINKDAVFWLDVAVFEKAFTLTKDIPGWSLTPPTAQELHAAVDLYTGELLECGYQDWCLYERTRFRHMYLIMLDKLMDYCTANNEFENGLIYGMRILRYDQARERTHRRLMRLHYLAHNRTDALRQYAQCAEILEKELGVQPARSTTELYHQIQADQLTPSNLQMFTQHTEPQTAVLPFNDSIILLQKLQQELSLVQQEIQQGIKTAEILLHNI
ncbi:MAG: hypothetical protein KDE48_00170 [Anaerolineales bacterium]|nr:hypothetical protein [Anaerolineales bacterium]